MKKTWSRENLPHSVKDRAAKPVISFEASTMPHAKQLANQWHT